ncbi:MULTISPECIES: LrgB family protein [unclassified Vibrio]|uniref:LrgB family protein n=1 Tax=Vibrio sp. HB236076 TaxID=3232307 RepID=A0AB39H9B8_9VIBR|nr:LrgB family protein [Vibrio sp. HB161653]MDP5253474.1 LrgB family protein [Vibrio sp. HB161653]
MWLIATLLCFWLTRAIAQKVNHPLTNPLLLSLIILISALMITATDYSVYLAQNHWLGDLLQPAVVALAYPLYEQLNQIKAQWRIILLTCALGSLLSMLTSLVIGLLFHLDLSLIAALLGKSVTTPIAMAVVGDLGGEPSIAAILVVIVGLFGAVLGYPIYRLIGIRHSLSRGLTMGNVSHALGTATCAEKKPQDAAFSSLALVLCGIITSILAPSLFAFTLWLAPWFGY